MSNDKQDRNTKIMRALYDSEIDIQITSQWDGGYRIAIGNGCVEPFVTTAKCNSDTSEADKYSQMVNDAADLAATAFPSSVFAKRFASGEFEEEIAKDDKQLTELKKLAVHAFKILDGLDYDPNEDRFNGRCTLSGEVNEDWLFYIKNRLEELTPTNKQGE